MLKFIFWSLLLANAGLLAYQLGYLDAWIPDGHEPARVKRQVHAESMKPMSAVAIAAALAPTAVANTAANAAAAPTCKEIGNFDNAGAKRFEALLQPLALGDKLSRRDIEEVANHIVYIPSLGSKEAADKKAAELRHFGVTDFYVIQDAGDFRWGISLGVFRTEDAARALLAAMNEKGVHSARLGLHSVAATKVAYRLRNLDAAALAGLDKATAEFPRAETRSCDLSASAADTATAPAGKPSDPRDVVR
jgi:hypothetical protein